MTQPQNPNQPWNGQPGDPNQPLGGQPQNPDPGAPAAPSASPAGGQGQWSQPAGTDGQQPPHGAGHPGQEHGAVPYAPAEEPKKGISPRTILSIVLAVLALGIGGYFLISNMRTGAALQPGKCVELKGEGRKIDNISEVKCDRDEFSWLITEVHEGSSYGACPDDQSGITYERGGRGSKKTNTYCTAPYFQEGKCYADTDDVMELKVVGCDDQEAKIRITEVKNEANATCAQGQAPFSVTDPARTACAERVK